MADLSEIERNAAAERQKLAGSLDALSAAISPENVKQHASALVENYGGDIGRQAWGAAKQNPAAFALVGAGLSLLLAGTGTRGEAQKPAPAAVPPGHASVGFDARVAAADAEIRQDMTGTMDTGDAPRATWLRAKLNDGLDALPDAARKRVLDARKAAIAAQEAVEEEARKTAQKSKTFLQEQPLAVGALALGLGALIGALLPSTRREDALLGEQRDAVLAAAKSTLQDELNKVRETTKKSVATE